jgi:hypothetical protein
LDVEKHIALLLTRNRAEIKGRWWITVGALGDFEVGIFFQRFGLGLKSHAEERSVDREVLVFETEDILHNVLGGFVLELGFGLDLVRVATVNDAHPHGTILKKFGRRRSEELPLIHLRYKNRMFQL